MTTTMREAIVAAHRRHDRVERNRLLRLARERGATVRALAALLGVGVATMHGWSGGELGGRSSDVLDGPAA